MSGIRALILTGYGLNCDHETAYAFELAGAKAARVHINTLIDGTVGLEDFQILVFGGGFSWGDDHGAGVIQAVRMKTNLGDRILEFVHQGKLVLGICNGFQTLVNLGLLPGLNGDYQSRRVALTYNDCGNFRDDWVWLGINPKSPCVFTHDLQSLELPVRHGEGKFVTDPETFQELMNNQQVAVQYRMPDGTPTEGRFPFNPNGSQADIAGICDPTGRIFGLMPHPEAYNHWTNHPDWPMQKEVLRRAGKTIDGEPTPGILLLQNGIRYLQNS